jgi:hypothetical protein
MTLATSPGVNRRPCDLMKRIKVVLAVKRLRNLGASLPEIINLNGRL